ncbi:class II fructose-bisphosphate aldolase [Eubacteriales bacterium OttesenSCG-928-N14]|nr:class II fructose-bisphosphate aldolase [Eubacteriales bacterium OttesenSCG-928-N14]
MYVSMKEMLNAARRGGYGVAAPNINNEDTIRACIEAAVELDAPIILDTGYGFIPDAHLADRIRELANAVDVPIALNLDHGEDFQSIIWAVRAGFTDVMADRSQLSFEDNVAEVSEVVKIAHAISMGVEAELGHVGDATQYDTDRNSALTNPDEAEEYVKRTNIDFLAVAIGTAHGAYSGTPYLDFPLLAQLMKKVQIPLVLHGGSGTGDENLARACREGITKINLATDLRQAGMQRCLEGNPKDMTRGLALMKEGYKEKLLHYMKLFGSVGKAQNKA